MKIPPWVFWVVVSIAGWKLFGDKLGLSAMDAAGPPESNPQASNPPSGTPAPNLFEALLASAQSIYAAATRTSQTSPRTT
jgi:hypothetical protein